MIAASLFPVFRRHAHPEISVSFLSPSPPDRWRMRVTLAKESKCSRFNETEHVLYSSPQHRLACVCLWRHEQRKKKLSTALKLSSYQTHEWKSWHDSMKSLTARLSAKDTSATVKTRDSSACTGEMLDDEHYSVLVSHNYSRISGFFHRCWTLKPGREGNILLSLNCTVHRELGQACDEEVAWISSFKDKVGDVWPGYWDRRGKAPRAGMGKPSSNDQGVTVILKCTNMRF